MITGGGGGLGRAMALAFARAGDRVSLLDRDAGLLAEAAGELSAAGHEVATHACDVTDPAACEAAMLAVERAAGAIDVLVNNAGVTHRSLFADTDTAVLRKVMEVNLFGAVHCTRAALPALLRSRGVIVAVSSVAGFAPLLGRTGYAASKHALHGFFGSLRTELVEAGVSVLIVCPSFVDTPLDRRAMAGDGAPITGPRALAGRPLRPDQVADAVLRAVARRRRLLPVSPVAWASLWLSRLLPAVYDRVMLRSQRGEFEERSREKSPLTPTATPDA